MRASHEETERPCMVNDGVAGRYLASAEPPIEKRKEEERTSSTNREEKAILLVASLVPSYHRNRTPARTLSVSPPKRSTHPRFNN